MKPNTYDELFDAFVALEKENQRLREAILIHKIEIERQDEPDEVDLELWAALGGGDE